MKIKVNNIEYESGENSIREFLKTILKEDFSSVLAVKCGDKVLDLASSLTDKMELETLTFESLDGKKVLWHTTSHVLAYAVKNIYGDAVKLAIGPPSGTQLNPQNLRVG